MAMPGCVTARPVSTPGFGAGKMSRVAEAARLESADTGKLYRGFEFLSLSLA